MHNSSTISLLTSRNSFVRFKIYVYVFFVYTKYVFFFSCYKYFAEEISRGRAVIFFSGGREAVVLCDYEISSAKGKTIQYDSRVFYSKLYPTECLFPPNGSKHSINRPNAQLSQTKKNANYFRHLLPLRCLSYCVLRTDDFWIRTDIIHRSHDIPRPPCLSTINYQRRDPEFSVIIPEPRRIRIKKRPIIISGPKHKFYNYLHVLKRKKPGPTSFVSFRFLPFFLVHNTFCTIVRIHYCAVSECVTTVYVRISFYT